MHAAAAERPVIDASQRHNGVATASDDAELVNAARQGDRAAFARLHQRYAPIVHGLLLGRVSHHDADDLMQQVFLTAMNKVRNIRQPQSFGPWVAALARNMETSFFRSQRVRKAHAETLKQANRAANATEVGACEEATRVLDCIRELPEAYRDALMLRLVEGLTGPQIAESLGMTHGSVRVNLHRGMEVLREKLSIKDITGEVQ
jgi:RNA polymerase sigma-70 factor (ECF subfamily)